MTEKTTNLDMPFIVPSQAQKHVTHNEALLKLDALVHLTIVSEQASPPAEPADGTCYLVAGSPTGLWAGKQGRVAAWQDGAWAFSTPKTGWRAWFCEFGQLQVFSDGVWQVIETPSSSTIEELGINAESDETNRLALSSPASLFNHAGHSHQMKINKAAESDVASLLFQTAFAGHAELGLAGSNDFCIKVSDGATWKTGLSISSEGHLRRPNQPAARAYRTGSNFTPVAGQESGFTSFALSQGGFLLGAFLAGGGSQIVVPASGLYLLALTVSVVSSSGHTTILTLNGTQSLIFVNGVAGGAQTQSASGIFLLDAGDYLVLNHGGSAQLEAGIGKTELSLTML